MNDTVLSTKVPRNFAEIFHKEAKKKGMTASSWLFKLAQDAVATPED